MDFFFDEFSNNGISIIKSDNCYEIFIPEYVKSQLCNTKINNWIKELEGVINENKILIPLKIKASEIYRTFYHFVE